MPASTNLITMDDVRQAAANIAGVAVRTPVLPCLALPGLWLKPESLQPTGAFKIRGAAHAVARLVGPRRVAGLVTHSSGNHGQALAYAARRFGLPCVVVMPDVAAPMKVEAVRALGARVELVPAAEREERTRQLARDQDLAVVPPFEHLDVIAGQATVGLEIVTDLPDLAGVLVPVGGGGLAAGVASVVHALRPGVPVVGVEPELAADAAESLRTGVLVGWPPELTYRTAADGLRTHLGALTFAHLRARLHGIVTVSEDELLSTVAVLARAARLVAEPSGAVATAAWLHRRADLPDRFGDGPVVAVVSGGNIDLAQFAELLRRSAGPVISAGTVRPA